MHHGLPLEILGLMCPLLSYIEGGVRGSLPEHWALIPKNNAERQREWLRRELPTYSYDNLDDIVSIGLNELRKQPLSSWNRHLIRDMRGAITPPNGYDLVDAFRKLAFHFFEWNGNILYIRNGLLVELHELGLRFPVRHLIRYAQVESVIRGYLSKEKALQASDQLDDLHSVYKGLRTTIAKGIAECHLHLTGILTPDEVWADHLFSRHAPSCFTGEELRLLTLGRRAVQLLALGVLLGRLPPFRDDVPHPDLKLPFDLITLMDKMYTATSRHEVGAYAKLFDDSFQEYKRETFLDIHDEPIDDDINDLLYHSDPSDASNPATAQDHQQREHERRQLQHERGQRRARNHRARQARDRRRGLVSHMIRKESPELLEWILPIITPRGTPSVSTGISPARPGHSSSTGMRRHIEVLNNLHFHTQHLLISLDKFIPWQSHDNPEFQRSLEDREDKQLQETPLRKFVHDAFYRYLIYQGHHWQRATQSGKTTGLKHFVKVRRVNQRKPLSDPIEGYGVAFERMTEQRALRHVEGRISTPRKLSGALPWILAFDEYREKGRVEQFGMVVHFIKQEEEPKPKKDGFYHQVRYASARRLVQREAKRLYRLLSSPNPVSPFIVGIDAANLELAVPPEIFAPAFRFLRDYPITLHRRESAVQDLDKHRKFFDQLENRRLGMTFHVGEDFRHLLSGLRAIDEVLEFLKPIPGDRLGHATALALSPETWAAQNGFQAVLSKQEWLDTLIWLHHHLGEGHPLLAELAVLDRIQRLSRQIYGASDMVYFNETNKRLMGRRSTDYLRARVQTDDGWSIPTLYDAWRLRQMDPYAANLKDLVTQNLFAVRTKVSQGLETKRWLDIQNEILDHVNQYVGSTAAYRLLGLYWFNPYVRHEGDQIIRVDMLKDRNIWLQICREAQKKLRAKVVEKQVIVETNPSSNRLIGPMNSFAEHYIFPLTMDENKKPSREVRVTVNTDNPGVTATSLTHEYYLLGEILLSEGIPEPQVVEWLDWLRENGMTYSFLNLMPKLNTPEANAFLAEIKRRYRYLSYRVSGKRTKYVPDYRELDQLIAEDTITGKDRLTQLSRGAKASELNQSRRMDDLQKQLEDKDMVINDLRRRLEEFIEAFKSQSKPADQASPSAKDANKSSQRDPKETAEE